MRWGRRFRFTVRTPLGSNQVGRRIRAATLDRLTPGRVSIGYAFTGWVEGDRFELVPLVAGGRGRGRALLRFSGRIHVRGPGDTRVRVVAKPRAETVAIPLFAIGLWVFFASSRSHGQGAFFWVWGAIVVLGLVAPLVLATDVRLVREALERILRDP
jgi:hypothetical protein